MIVALLVVILAAGCASAPDIIQALANDPASSCTSVQTPYGGIRVYRTNVKNGTVRCSDDGLSVRTCDGDCGQLPANIPAHDK